MLAFKINALGLMRRPEVLILLQANSFNNHAAMAQSELTFAVSGAL